MSTQNRAKNPIINDEPPILHVTVHSQSQLLDKTIWGGGGGGVDCRLYTVHILG
jgi:hypothetical protein